MAVLQIIEGDTVTYFRDYIAGRLFAQGLALSNCAASFKSIESSPNLPENITPIGKPSADQCNGTDIEGCPVTL